MNKKDKLKKDIGKRVDFIRKTMEMSKEEFAKIINVSGQHLGKVIIGEKGLSIEKVIEISEKTRYTTDFILKGITSESEKVMDKKVSKIKNNLKEINQILKTI